MAKFTVDTTDAKLVKAIRNSETNGFKTLYYRYSDMLFSFLWRKIRSHEIAEDLVQELFMRLWKNRLNLDEKLSIKSYLYRSANNLAIDHLRKKVVDQENIISNPQSEPFYCPDDWFDFEDHIKQALTKLPDAQRNVFYLSRFEGLKYNEIAQVLHISPKTVETHMIRALKKLREALLYLLTLFFIWIFL